MKVSVVFAVAALFVLNSCSLVQDCLELPPTGAVGVPDWGGRARSG